MKTFHVTLTEPEMAALAQLMDAGVKASGLQAVRNAAVLVARFEAAKPVEAAPPKVAEPVADQAMSA